MAELDADKHLISDLWLDQPDALEQIEQREAAGAVTPAEAEKLRAFAIDGYTSIWIDLDEAFDRTLQSDLDRLWRTRPYDLAVQAKSGDRVSFRDFELDAPEIGYRIVDLHSHSSAARSIYLHPQIFRMVELIFDQPAIAFQSLFFGFGSEQSLHRDPMFVATDPPSHLVASWACRRGEVFLWHAGLLHGGSPVTDPKSTRTSFVTHYSTARTYRSRGASMKVRVPGTSAPQWVGVRQQTDRVLDHEGCRGLDNPLRGIEPEPPGRPVRVPHRARSIVRTMRRRLTPGAS